MSACLTGASVIHERALETCETSCVTRAAKSFFVPVVHSPLGAMGYMAAPELSSWGDRAWSLGTRGSSGAALSQKSGVGAQATRGGPGAALRWEAGAEATGTRGAPGAALSQVAGVGTLGHAGTHVRLIFYLCNIPATPGLAIVTSDSYLGS
jgi:hypothetical protein